MELNDKTAFYKVCFDSMQVGIVVFDQNKKIVLANIPASKLFGFKKNKFLGRKIDDFVKEKYLIDKFIQSPSKKEFKSTQEITGYSEKGNELFLELSFGEMKYEGHIYFKALISDITERKLKEAKISHLNVQLEKEVKVSNEELKKVIAQLKSSLSKEIELNKLKTKFIAMASHEFKTPLSAILSSTELMAKYSELDNVEKRDEHLQKVKGLIARLNGMLDDMLKLENVESSIIEPRYRWFYLNEIILKLTQLLNPFLKKNQFIKIENEIRFEIFQDPEILNIVITNLLNNAIKYSGEASTILLRIEQFEKHLEITVKDSGIGIPSNEKHLIFQRFFRAKNVLYSSGTGIGLNIVKGYVESLNGTIYFESEENVGTTFTVILPNMINNEKESFIN